MAKIFVIAEHRDGRLKKSTFELLGAASSAGHDTHAILLGEGVAGLAAELGHYGAKQVHVAESSALKLYSAEAYTFAVVEIAKKHGAEVILASHTPTGRDFMPRVSFRLGTGLASDCVGLNLAGGVVARRPVYAGKASCEVEFIGSGPKCLTVRANALGIPKPNASLTAKVNTEQITFAAFKTKVLEVVKGQSARPDVTEASIVVSGGRAMKNAENFKIV